MSAVASVTVRQIKSGIGYPDKQKRTLRALGLGRVGKSRSLPDNDQVRGMIAAVSHLLEVDGQEKGAAR